MFTGYPAHQPPAVDRACEERSGLGVKVMTQGRPDQSPLPIRRHAMDERFARHIRRIALVTQGPEVRALRLRRGLPRRAERGSQCQQKRRRGQP